MARAALPRRLTWQLGSVVDVLDESPRARSLLLDVTGWAGHAAGQHVDIRLTSDDGYQAQRSYSIASAPTEELLRLTVVRYDDGEVSPYLTTELRAGDTIELRGPIGGYFLWEPSMTDPLQLIGGGAGIVPLRAMLRQWADSGRPVPARLLYSARSLEDAIFRDELTALAAGGGLHLEFALTREWPPDWAGHHGRIDGPLVERSAFAPGENPDVFICGPTPFVESAAQLLVGAGHPASRIRTERFGATGG